MLSELTKKGILTIKGLVDECKAGIDQTNKELEVIDEKYRKIIAEEKKTLKSNLAEYKMQLKQYEKMFGTFDATAVKEVLGDFESTATVEEPEQVVESTPTVEEAEVIVDTIFPENNQQEEEEEEEKEAVPVLAKNLDDEEDVDWDEKIESGELVEVTVEDEKPSEENKDSKKEEEEEVAVLEDSDWPDFNQW